MPRPAKGPRLYLHPGRQQWVIRDGTASKRTGCGAADRKGAERQLGLYLAEKFEPAGRESDLARLPVVEVLTAYGREYVVHQKSAERSSYAIAALAPWWTGKYLSDVRGATCRGYAAHRRSQGISDGTIRRELAALSKAISHWHSEHGPLTSVPDVTMPSPAEPKDRWLTRSEFGMLLAGALGFYRVFWSDVVNRRAHARWERNPWTINRHLARFLLLDLYSGSRKGAVFSVWWMPNTAGGWIDMDRGVMHRRASGVAETKKRQPPVRLGRRILAHLRRWKRLDDEERDRASAVAGEPVALFRSVISYEGRPVSSVRTAWASAIENAWLSPEFTGQAKITPHVLRHTRATWMMHAGVEIWEAAGSLGMSPKTLERVYGHHHADFQKRAAEV